jgi:two-component system sensor histidine kinase PilS (NtrC family)
MSLFDFGHGVTEIVPAWRELSIFAAYRLFLSATLFVVYWLKLHPEFLGSDNPELYSQIILLYLVLALLLIFITFKK